MKLSHKTSENLLFNIEQDTPKDNIANSIFNCIRRCADKIESVINRETITISKKEKTLSETIEYNVRLNTGKEIKLNEIDKDQIDNDKIEKYEVCLSKHNLEYEDRLREIIDKSRDLLNIKNEDERRQFVLNSTPLELSKLLRPNENIKTSIKEELKSLIDESKYDYSDRRDPNDICNYAFRVMDVKEMQQFLDCKDVFCLGNYSKICMFPASQVYETRAKEIFSDSKDLDVKFKIRSDQIYNNLSVGRYSVSKYDSGNEFFKSSLLQDPCLDIVIKERQDDDIVKVLAPEYQLESYNISQLIPVEINGQNVSDMTISQISDFIKIILDKDMDEGILGTGKVLENMARENDKIQ